MAAQAGRSYLLKVEDSVGAGTYTTIAGLRNVSMTYNNADPDVTTADDSGNQKFLAAAGQRGVTVTAEGIFNDDNAYQLVRNAVRAGSILSYQLVAPGDTNAETIQANFSIESLAETGADNESVTFSISIKSSGTVSVS